MLMDEVYESAMKISGMLEMQRALNESIMKEKGLTFGDEKFNPLNLKRAIIDEVGELNHELKSDWCWWKNTQKEKNYAKVLEELVDVWHFVLSQHYLPLGDDYPFYDDRETDIMLILIKGMTRAREGVLNQTDPIINFLNSHMTLVDLVELTFLLAFDIDQVYDAYIAKNKENYERLKRGY